MLVFRKIVQTYSMNDALEMLNLIFASVSDIKIPKLLLSSQHIPTWLMHLFNMPWLQEG